jgi:DNA-nicking Smr family endonuclease
MARRPIGEEEKALWLQAMRGVQPLKASVDPAPLVSVRPKTLRSSECATPQVSPQPSKKRGQDPLGDGLPRIELSFFSSDLSVGEAGQKKYFAGKVRKGRGVSGNMLPSDHLTGDLSAGQHGHEFTRRPERRLDLHGMVAQAAFLRLHGFLASASMDGVRCVEIITGLGSSQEGGILRRELPLWLDHPDLRRLIVAAGYAHPGNQGAVRLTLRRAR